MTESQIAEAEVYIFDTPPPPPPTTLDEGERTSDTVWGEQKKYEKGENINKEKK
jgi:hypothetical protein